MSDSTTRRLRSRTAPVAFMAVMGGLFAACGEEEDETAYCVTEDNVVVENDYCGDEERGGSVGFFWLYGGAYGLVRAGQRLDPSRASGRVVSTDKGAITARGGLGGAKAGGVGRGGGGTG